MAVQSGEAALASARAQVAELQAAAQRGSTSQQAMVDSLRAQLDQRDERIRRLTGEQEQHEEALQRAQGTPTSWW